jgi:diguanylate cyclase (GGDEF)-like protein
MVADLKGNYSNTLRRNAGNASDRDYFKNAMEGEVVISNPVISRTNGKPVTIIAAPIINDDGKIEGVMAGAINLIKLSRIIENLKYNYPNSYSYIVDKNGLILAHPNNEYILKQNITVKSDTINEQMTGIAAEILNNDEGSNKYSYGNVSSMNYYHIIPNTDGWKLIIKIPVEYWHAPIRHAGISLILIGLVGLIIASILGLFIAKSISKPVISLNELFTEATEGNLNARSEIDTDDEIGDAARSFNKMMDTISSLTYYDSLTLLPNKMLFNASFEAELEKASRENSKLAIMTLDVDKFENINNTLGHAAGDKLLKSLAEKIVSIVDHTNMVSHIGEDRFAVLFKYFKNKDEVIQLANEVRDAIKQPWVIDGHRFYITACIGLAFYPEDGNTSSGLMKNAFSAMQKAKRRGRDSYQLYEPSQNAWLLEQLNMDSSMHRALDNGEFSLHYQPQIDAKTKEVIGCEALIRWNHPELGIISPLKFIPISEVNGLITLIGRWALYTACTQNKLWQDAGHKPIYVSVNLSAIQLIQEDFIDVVSGVLKETGLSPEYLELEITESVAVKNHEYIMDILEKLKRMNIRIALDDFGTGYSSLNYLKDFAISTIKIDRSFICDINENPKNAAIVSTILALGHNLKLKVTAEGIETKEQYETLRDQGCDIIQGYYFSKPLPLNEFEKLWLK